MSNIHKFPVGSKLRVVKARGGLPFAVGAVLTATAQINSCGWVRYAVDGNDNDGVGWDEDRFVAVPRKVASESTAPGSTVICVDNENCAAKYLTVGRIYTVRAQGGDGLILEGVEHPYDEWNYSRFEVVTEAAPIPTPTPAEPARKFKAGDKVRAKRKIHYPLIQAGETRVVSGYNALGNLTVEGEGQKGVWESDFDLVREVKEGDKVRALRGTLDITQGRVYTVLKDSGGFVRVTDDVGDDNSMLNIADYELVEASPTVVYKVIALLANASPWSADYDSIEAAEQAIARAGNADVSFEIFSTVRTVHRTVKLVETTTRELVNV